MEDEDNFQVWFVTVNRVVPMARIGSYDTGFFISLCSSAGMLSSRARGKSRWGCPVGKGKPKCSGDMSEWVMVSK